MNDQDPQTMSNAAVAERMTSRISNSLVIAAGLVALGLYASGDETEAPTYQAVSMPDGRVVRLNTESGSVVSCDSNRCAIIYLQGDRLPRIDGREASEEGDGDGDGDGAAPAQPAAPQPPALPAPPASPPPGAAVQPPGPGQTPQPAPGPAQPNPGQPGR